MEQDAFRSTGNFGGKPRRAERDRPSYISAATSYRQRPRVLEAWHLGCVGLLGLASAPKYNPVLAIMKVSEKVILLDDFVDSVLAA